MTAIFSTEHSVLTQRTVLY